MLAWFYFTKELLSKKIAKSSYNVVITNLWKHIPTGSYSFVKHITQQKSHFPNGTLTYKANWFSFSIRCAFLLCLIKSNQFWHLCLCWLSITMPTKQMAIVNVVWVCPSLFFSLAVSSYLKRKIQTSFIGDITSVFVQGGQRNRWPSWFAH